MAINEQRFMILVALANRPLHGYGIADEIRSITDGSMTPKAGSLYHALDKLAEQALVVVDRDEVVDGRLRRYYKLTESGTSTLAAEAQRRQRSAAVALERLNLAFGIVPRVDTHG